MRIELKRGANTAAVNTKGGELVSFRDGRGLEYIWQGDAKSWLGQNPNLFPIVGNLKDGRVTIDGKACEMSRHGFARRSEFAIAEKGEDYVVMELRHSPETLACYPYQFIFRVRYQLVDNGFSTQFEVQNPGDKELLFCVGAHTGINCPLEAGKQFEDYRLVFDQPEDIKAVCPTEKGLTYAGRYALTLENTDTLPLDHGVFDRVDTLIFEGLRSTGVTLRPRDGGREVHMEFGEFPMIAFWTMPNANAPYLCLEPWHGCAAREDESGDFADKPYAVRLAPGGEKKLKYTVTIR